MKLDDVIDSVRRSVPECVAAAAVDLPTGMLLTVRAGDDHHTPDLDLLAIVADNTFQSDQVTALCRAFGDDPEGRLRELVMVGDGVLVVAQRCPHRPTLAVVVVSRAAASLGMVVARARACIASVEPTLLASLAA